MRKIEWTPEGPVLYKRLYTPWKNRISSIGQTQKQDGILIQRVSHIVGLSGIYAEEYPDYIEDYEGPKTVKNTIRLQSVFFDHVLFTEHFGIIFESDDRSHYDRDYCLQRGFNYEDIQKRDRIKNIWARRNNIKLVRLREYKLENGEYKKVGEKEKMRILFKVLRDVKALEDSIRY